MTEKQVGPALSDEALIELYFKRDERAISETEKKYGKLVYRIAYNVLGDHSDTEECQNDTYLKVWNEIPPTKPRVFAAFIAQITRRTAINRFRQKRGKKQIPTELTASADELYAHLKPSKTAYPKRSFQSF